MKEDFQTLAHQIVDSNYMLLISFPPPPKIILKNVGIDIIYFEIDIIYLGLQTKCSKNKVTKTTLENPVVIELAVD